MNKLRLLKCALAGGASAVALASPAAAKVYDIPDGDLSTALVAYMKQSDVEIIYANDAVRGHRSKGAKGDYTETAALTQLLRGTGFTARPLPESNAISIVAAEKAASERVKVAEAAKPSAPPPQQAGLETVVVTAQKKSEDIQTVPISITALSQQQLTERQIAGGPDLVKEVPNLTFSKTNFSGYNLEIRGIGTQAISVTTDPAVAVAFNGIPFIRNHFFEQEFFDVDNVEVLRGPQGTLYGRNATAGVVNLISAKPTDSYEAMVSADMGNFSNRRLEGMLNLPIVGDTLDLRIAGEWTKRDGYTEDTTTGTPVDGRDLWSGRMTLGWKPASNVQTYLVWEHFSEDDDRLRSGKQLCKTDPGLTEVDGVSTTQGGGSTGNPYGGQNYFSQGCEMTSLYSPSAFEVPNGNALPYYEALSLLGGWINSNVDPYASSTQSTNLRQIESSLLPTYKAKNDTLEFNADWAVTPALTLTSQTGYNHDFLWSTEDYNRFNSSPGLFNPNSGDNILGQVSPSGVFCDPQLGCSNKLEAMDLSDEHAWQLSQEFRLSSNFDGPLNFSVGANYLHYETEENYYVFINAITLVSTYDIFGGLPLPPWNPRTSDNAQCLSIAGASPYAYNEPLTGASPGGCVYIDDNPVGSLNNEGHNYFLSQNPYLLNSYAGFGEVYYNLTNDLKLTTGARWTDDQKQFTEIPSWIGADGYGYPIRGIVNQSWNEWTGRFAADWTPRLDFTDQSLFYFSAAHGYKAGGANPPGAVLLTQASEQPTHPLTFKPEFIEAFELGTKNSLLDDTLTLNGDLFYYNYTGYQISQIVDRTSVNLNFNAHVEGAEVETTWEPSPGLKFSFSGGFLDTTLAGGTQAVDLMDRTAGNPNYVLVKPFLTYASNCVLPTYVVVELLNQGGYIGNLDGQGACGEAYAQHFDPVTGLPYTPYPFNGGIPTPGAYPGFNPATAPNGGAGIAKDLGGNQLPNAPHFTTSLTAEYTIPVSDDWAATLHGDFYWQSQQWARAFEDPIDKVHGYSNVNLSLILTGDTGWQVMGYVKNVFNVTAITGTFLNSDDTGLTTNVFLTDPRLYGIRVTKHLDQDDGIWGSGSWSGAELIDGLFADKDGGRPPVWIELGGDFEILDDSQQILDPPFVKSIPADLGSVLGAQHPPRSGLDWEGKATYQPDGSDWVFGVAVRYGRATNKEHNHHQTSPGLGYAHFGTREFPTVVLPRYSDVLAASSEAHGIFDFTVGKDVGIGLFDPAGTSTIEGGVRLAQFVTHASAQILTDPDNTFATQTPKYHRNFSASSQSKRSFHGIGPTIAWNGSDPLAGNTGNSELTVDWGANFAVLFGRRKAAGVHATNGDFHCTNGIFTAGAGCHVTSTQYQRGPTRFARAGMATVPNLGGFAGISWRYSNVKVSFGYRADEFFGAMDGGIDTRKSENVGFFGPYANISIGLGG